MEKKATIMYLLNEEGRKASLLAGGDGKERQKVQADITPELLELTTVDQDGNAVLDLTKNRPNTALLRTDVYGVRINLRCKYGGQDLNPVAAEPFSAPQTAEQLIKWEKARQDNLEEQVAELEPLAEQAKREHAEEERIRKEDHAKREAERAEREARELAAEKAAKEAALKDRTEWIAEYGSDYLRRATRLGYNCQRQYVTERAAHEYPEYIVDFDRESVCKTRSCPSMEALVEVEALIEAGVSAEVVWLTHPAYKFESYDDEMDWEPCEAITIEDYLTGYTLVREV